LAGGFHLFEFLAYLSNPAQFGLVVGYAGGDVCHFVEDVGIGAGLTNRITL